MMEQKALLFGDYKTAELTFEVRTNIPTQEKEQEQQKIPDQQKPNADTLNRRSTKEHFTFFNGVSSIYHQEYIALFTVSRFSYN